jgi:hypothetical protein
VVSNLDRYKKDVDSLSRKGKVLRVVMEAECFPERFKTPEWKEKLKALPRFKSSYQSWYSEARWSSSCYLTDLQTSGATMRSQRLEEADRDCVKWTKTIANTSRVVEQVTFRRLTRFQQGERYIRSVWFHI